MESVKGKDIKMDYTIKCKCCENHLAVYEWHRLTHDLIFTIGYKCICGDETVVRRSIRWEKM